MNEFDEGGRAAGFLSVMIALLYFGTVYALEKIGGSTIWKPFVRGILADYAYVVSKTPYFSPPVCLADCFQFCTIFWVGFSHIGGNIANTNLARLPTTKAFYPTQPRGWLIDFWNLEVKWVFVALPFGFLVMLLFYYDHVRKQPHPMYRGITPDRVP